jgi:osmoprotectant transport system substrate-binding protein
MHKKLRLRKRGLALGAMVVAFSLLAVACGGDDDDDDAGSNGGGEDRGALDVGAKDFPSAQLISQLYGQVLAADGYDVSYTDLGPTETTYPALEEGEIDLYGEYQGTLLSYLEGEPTADAEETNELLQDALGDGSVVASGPSSAVDVNGFYVTTETAEQYGLETVSDLKPVAGELTFGGPPECEERPLCLGDRSQELYGLQFREVQKLDVGGPVTVTALEDGSIQVAILFTGSSVLRDNFVLLEDDQGLQPADNAIAVWKRDVDSEALSSAVERVNEVLTTEVYNELSLRISEEREDPEDVAQTFLEEKGLL